MPAHRKDGKPYKNPVPITKDKFKIALVGSGGIKTVIAKRLKVSWVAINEYIKRHPDIKEAYEAERQRIGDIAESRIINSIKDEKDLALASQNARWYLSRRHKDRGYGNEKMVRHSHQKHVPKSQSTIKLNLDKMPLKLKKELLNFMKNEKSNKTTV